jgi:aspartyl-tRNA synthetase
MHLYKLSQISENILNEKVHIAGWLHNKRDHGGVLFLDIRAFGEKVQVVVEKQEMIDVASKIKLESVLNIIGGVRMRPDGSINLSLKSGKVEVVASEIIVENEKILTENPKNNQNSEVERKIIGEKLLAERILQQKKQEEEWMVIRKGKKVKSTKKN